MTTSRFSRIAVLLLLALAIAPQLRAAGNVVTINSDNVLVINGRKIFPIGFTIGPPPDGKTPSGKNGLQELADAGGTFMRTGANGANWSEETFATEKQWEDAAAAHGLYCWLYLHDLASIKDGDTKREALLRRVVNEFKDHPGFGIWKGADEPEWGKAKIPPLVKSREIVRSLDANHPLAVIQAPRGTIETLRPYNAAADITGVDIYPISYPPGTHSLIRTNTEITLVGDYTLKMMDVAQGKQPVWMVLQIAWSGVVKPGKTLRFPTFAQERFMSYQAIINGARGIVYFGGNVEKAMTPADAKLGWNWTFWNRVLKPVMDEIGTKSALEPALVAPDSKMPVKVTGNGIEYCVRESGDSIYILACKREGATIEATFTGLAAPDGLGEVMYESPRQVEIHGGKFTDWFGPFDVHVYKFKR